MRTLILHIISTLIFFLLLHYFTYAERADGQKAMLAIFFFLLFWISSYIFNRSYFDRFLKFWSLFIYFIKHMFISNFRVSIIILTPKLKISPGIIAYPLRAKTDLELGLLANIITLTPGTLSLDVSPNREFLYIHTIDIHKDPDAFIKEIQDGFERKILEFTR